MNGPIILTESTKRIGYVNALARKLYRTVGHDKCMAIVNQLNAGISLPEREWDRLCATIVPDSLRAQ